MSTILIRLPQTMALTGDRRSTLYLKVQKGLLPKPIRLGTRTIAWVQSEIEAINRARIAGKSEDEIRQLVKNLEQSRLQA